MEWQPTKTGLVVADLTVYSDGRVEWGEGLDSPRACHVVVTRANMPDEPGKKKQWRLGFHFKRREPPMWWGIKFRRLVEAEMYARRKQLEKSAAAAGRGIVEGN